MEEQKTLILSVDFQSDKALKRAADLRASIDADKAALQELNKTIKESGQATAEQALSREKLELAIRQNTRARSEELRAVDNYLKATKAQLDANGKWTGSIKEIRASVGFLTEQWNNLSRAERENKDVGGVLQRDIKSLTDELKELEGSVGDNRRSVGGYLDAIRQAPGAMGKFKAGINGISAAMSANPLGLILQFLPQIQALFESSGEGADAFAKAMGMVNAIVQEGLKRLVSLGGAAFKLFTGDFKGAFTEGQKALSGFGDAITKAVNEGGALAESIDAIEEKERAFRLESAKTQKQIDQLMIQARNRTTSEAERQKLYDRAEKLEVQRNERELALANERVAITKRENALKQEDTDAQDERLKEAERKVIEIEQQSQNIREKIAVRRDQLAQAEEEKRKAAQEKRLKEFEDNRKKATEELEEFNKFMTKLREDKAKEVADLQKKESEARLKTQTDQVNATAAANKAEMDQAKADAAERKRLSDLAITQKEKEFQAISGLATAGQNLFAALAEENSNFAEFEKALSLFKIGVSSAEAISKGIAAAAAAGPFPYNLVAIATTVASVSASLLQAKNLIDSDAPKPPKSKMAEGGLLEGPSHAAGGIRGTGSFAGVEVEGGEAVINRRSTARFAGLLNFINQAGGGKPLSPTTYAAAGGILSPAAYQPLGGRYMNQGQSPVIDYGELAKAMAAQPVYVRPTEIVSKANQTNARKANARIG